MDAETSLDAASDLSSSTLETWSPPKPWFPPGDLERTYLPYLPGAALWISRHTAPLPPYEAMDLLPPRSGDETYLRSITQSKFVVDNPIRAGSTPAFDDSAQLVITAPITVGPDNGAQIVRCAVRRQDRDKAAIYSFDATAKTYDPMYYDFRGHDNKPRDMVYTADRDYSTEVAAFEQLVRTGQTGSFTPRYYGSWSVGMVIPTGGQARAGDHVRTRPVRLILMEPLYGRTIQDARDHADSTSHMRWHPFLYPEAYRLEVLARAMDAHVKLLAAGVDQADFNARNVLLVHQDPNRARTFIPRVVFINYSNAVVTAKPNSCQKPADLGMPESPLSRFHGWDVRAAFWGWVPQKWYDRKCYAQWLLERFHGPL